ncbi:MAG: AarF/ABC1/UbiB kinase family protein [Deltaproteobacteria bacterium]|nr:AarF/ABC1/UbiB kinase family protein [Deltaproteobacteria bacterium]
MPGSFAPIPLAGFLTPFGVGTSLEAMAVPYFDHAAKDLRRLREIVGVMARHGFGELVRKTPNVPVDVTDLKQDEVAEPAVTPPARRFRLMLEELGPTFIKLGQVLSSRPDLISREYLEELKHLQYECEPIAFEEIHAAIHAGLGREVTTAFTSIDEKAVATASIAQVHRAVTTEGRVVAIKVQRPGIDQQLRADVDILYRFARLLDAAIEESSAVESVGVVREFEAAILAELDFRVEAQNLREFKRTHEGRDDVVIPAVLEELTSSTLLTLEWLDGVPFTSLPTEGLDRPKIARRVLQEAFDEVFIDGFFHADPHPGNILLLADGRYAILDLGVCGRLTQKMRDTIVVLALAIALKDADTAARTLYRLGHADSRVSIASLRDDLRTLFARYLDRPLDQVDSTLLGQELLSLAIKHRIRVPSEYTMLARACATIEGVVRQLDPTIDIAHEATPYAERLLFERVGPGRMEGGIYRTLLQLQGMSEDVPIQISQVLADAAAGNFFINVRGTAMDRLANSIVTASAVLSGSIVLAAFIVGTFIALAVVDWAVLGIPLAALVGALGAVTVFFWVGAYAVIWPRVRKISVTRLFSRKRR